MKSKFILLLLLQVCVLELSAKELPPVVFSFPGTGFIPAVSASGTPYVWTTPVNYTTTDPGYLSGPGIQQFYKNTITLRLKAGVLPLFDFGLQVTGKTRSASAPSGTLVQTPVTFTITYNHLKGMESINKDVFAFTEAAKVDLIVETVTITQTTFGFTNTDIANAVEFSISYDKDLILPLNPSSIPQLNNPGWDESSDEIVLSWKEIPEAGSYDVEYTFIEDYDGIGGNMPATQLYYNFRENAARINTQQTYYRLPRVFEKGYFLYRVRAAGRGGVNNKAIMYGTWSGGAEQGIVSNFTDYYYNKSAHMEDFFNWQLQTTFAEGGRRKDVVDYSDGTLRLHQTVTAVALDKTDFNSSIAEMGKQYGLHYETPGSKMAKDVIAGETVYDHEGRPAVNILPVPVGDMRLQYYDKLNVDATGKNYHYTNFDGQANCKGPDPLAPVLQNGTVPYMGAATYYSKANNNQSGFNAFIPNADGYPFMQTAFTPDNTGRVKMQTIPGITYKMGDGHETVYFYGAPNQPELDRMFGTEVGYAGRYQKNAVMDANGQVSVSYVNPEGKTIATALAGKVPDNVDALPGRVATIIKASLIDKTVIDSADKTITINHDFIVTDKGDYTIDYSLKPGQFAGDYCKKEFCLDCIYDLAITLIHHESCTSDPLFAYSGTLGKLFKEKDGPEADLQCNYQPEDLLYPRQKIVGLEPGTYSLQKKLSINKQAAETYVNAILKDTCRLVYDKMLKDELDKADTLSCYKNCDSCKAQPLTPTAQAQCDETLCEPIPNRCDMIKQMMMGDLSPGGQYGEYDMPGGVANAFNYPVSIFNPGNVLGINKIWTSISGAPAVLQQYITANDLTGLVANWQPEWAEYFLPLHPEYCQSEWCLQLPVKKTYDFDVILLTKEHYTDAITDGLINPSLVTSGSKPAYLQLINQDPFFDAGLNNALKQVLLGWLQQFPCGNTQMDADKLAMSMAYCEESAVIPASTDPLSPGPIDPGAASCTLPANYFSVHSFGQNPGSDLADMEWHFLRVIYNTLKESILYQHRMQFLAPGQKAGSYCYNDCIGNKYFNFFTRPDMGIGGIGWGMQPWPPASYFNNNCPCNQYNAPYLAGKQKRFTDVRDAFLQLEDAGIQINLAAVDPGNPCSIIQIVNQSASINSQVKNTICHETTPGEDSVCNTAAGLEQLIDTALERLKSAGESIKMKGDDIPLALKQQGITATYADWVQAESCVNNFIRFTVFQGDNICSFIIKNTGQATKRLVKVCCISTIKCCGESGNFRSMQFTITLIYNSGPNATETITSDCAYLCNCLTGQPAPKAKVVEQTPGNTGLNIQCNNPSAYATAFFNVISQSFKPGSGWNFSNDVNVLYPDVTGLLNLETRGWFSQQYNAGDKPVKKAVVTTNGKTVITLFNNAGKPGESKGGSCAITIGHPGIDEKNIVSLSSVKPDYSTMANNNVHSFTIDALIINTAGSVTRVTLKGAVDCLPLNRCHTITGTWCTTDTADFDPAVPYANTCVTEKLIQAKANAANTYQHWKDSMEHDLYIRYYRKCLTVTETLDITYTDAQHHYTLYYYDQAGNLVKTIPPAGVELLPGNLLAAVANSRNNNGAAVVPAHTMATHYKYNSLDQLVMQSTPDGGTSKFYYDRLSRLVASQNAKQAVAGSPFPSRDFSYSLYDKLGRVIETGQLRAVAFVLDNLIKGSLGAWTNYITTNATRTEVVQSIYDKPYNSSTENLFGSEGQRNLRNRVSSILRFANTAALTAQHYSHASLYSYDIAGNVPVLIQDYPGTAVGHKRMDYEFSLHSGKVNKLIYQQGQEDQFIHRYRYDAENRIMLAETSPDDIVWTTDAKYIYYRHGSLARTETGEYGVQGTDNLYTLQGWLKGANGVALDPGTDAGSDGIPQQSPGYIGYGTHNKNIARDAYGYVLDYYTNDYKNITGSRITDPLQQSVAVVSDLYNGNISRMYTQLPGNSFKGTGNMGMNYRYDQLHRLISQQAWNLAGNDADAIMQPLKDEYAMWLKYDANGNITSLERNGYGSNLSMDKLIYKYYQRHQLWGNTVNYGTNLTGTGVEKTNRLLRVRDQVSSSNYAEDIDDQAALLNYNYDPIGNLISDVAEGIKSISWNLQNKISRIIKTDGSSLLFEYDAMGNRVMKQYNPASGLGSTTYYVLDAQGNVMSTYEERKGKLNWREATIYGTNRTGIWQPDRLMTNVPVVLPGVSVIKGKHFIPVTGRRQYELTNHLGNVLVTISDKKIPVADHINPMVLDWYDTDVRMVSDYYAFGQPMPGRNYQISDYRYGYNTQEKVDELSGNGNHYTAKFWEYDPRIARRWNRDPFTFAWQSPYAINNNNPIVFTDPLGLFGSRKEAREYKREHGLKGRIQKGADDVFSINNKKEGTSYYKDQSLDDIPNVLGRQEDGVIKTVLVTGDEVSAPSSGAYVDGAEEFGKRGFKLKVSTEPLKSTGKIKFYSNAWGGNQYIKTKNVFSKGLTKGIAKHAPIIGHLLDAKEVIDGFQADGNSIGSNTAIEAAGVVGSAGGAWAGAAGGAAIGSLIFPGVGTVIGGVIGAIAGSWGGEELAEAGARKVLKE